MVSRLYVFLSDRRIGVLDDLAGNMQFVYEVGAQTPLSVNLPIRAAPYDNAACRPFFNNLLPEGSWRQSLCRQLRIDEPSRAQRARVINVATHHVIGRAPGSLPSAPMNGRRVIRSTHTAPHYHRAPIHFNSAPPARLPRPRAH